MTNHGKIHNCMVDLTKRGEWLETYKQEDGRTYFHCSPFWILYHRSLFPFKKKAEIKIERQSPCSHHTSIHPKIQWNWFTQHFHVPSWWVPHWINSWKGIREALPCVTAGETLKGVSSETGCSWGPDSPYGVQEIIHWGQELPIEWFGSGRDAAPLGHPRRLEAGQRGKVQDPPVTGGWAGIYVWRLQVGEQWLPLKGLLVRSSYYP